MSVHSKPKAEGQSVNAPSTIGHMAKNVMRINAFQKDIAFYLPNPSDHIQKIIRGTKKFYEQSMLADIGPLLPENPTVIDVGANIGNHSLFFAKVIDAQVVSFEPNPEAFAILEASISLNQLGDQVELHQIAVGAGKGLGEINKVSEINLGMAQVVASHEGSVQIQSLDEVLGTRHVDLIRIDVEGMKYEVLKGAEQVLKRCKPVLIAEAATLEELSGIEDLLRPYGYRKVQRYNDTPTFLFQYGLEPSKESETFTGNLLTSVGNKLPETTGIYAGMATVAGNEVALRSAVMSLLPQVDRLFLYLNGYSEVPPFLERLERVTCQLDPTGTRYGDAGKFWGLEQIKDAIYLTCDDDIIYPQDYVQRMTEALAELKGRAVVCVHGSLLVQPMENFYASGSRSVLHFAGELIRRRQVHVPGTGTCAFHSSIVNIGLDQFEAPNMADIWLTKFMTENHLVAYAVAHKGLWLQPLEVNRPNIFDASSKASQGVYDTSVAQTSALKSLMPLSISQICDTPQVVCLDLERDSNILSALKELPIVGRDPVVLIMCDAATDDIRAKIAQSSYNWEVHLLPRSQSLSPAIATLFQNLSGDVSFWKVEKRRLVEDGAAQNLQEWLECLPN